MPPSSSTIRTSRPSARRSPTATTSATASTTTAASSSTRATPGGRPRFFVVTPRNIQYDSVTDDASNEDASPDFFWESATKITARGWTLEMRIPFSSLRYKNVDPQTWGILLYRNYPRDHHYQFFSARLPRGGNCFVCRSNSLVGLEHLPGGGHLVAAPYVSGDRRRAPARRRHRRAAGRGRRQAARRHRREVHAERRQRDRPDGEARLLPGRVGHGADLGERAFRPVLSREASVLPRRRRSVPDADPGGLHADDHRAGLGRARSPGRTAGFRYTALVADDAGGGSAIIPGPNGSSLASVDYGSTVFVARVKRDIGLSFVGVLATDREARSGDSHNRVVGPDFQWRPSGTDVVTGQALYSETRTPNRPDLARRVDRQSFASHAGEPAVAPQHDASRRLRALQGSRRRLSRRHRLRAAGGLSRGRPATAAGRSVPPGSSRACGRSSTSIARRIESGALISSDVEPGVGMDTRWNGFMQFRYIDEDIRAGDRVIGRKRFGYIAQFSPSRRRDACCRSTARAGRRSISRTPVRARARRSTCRRRSMPTNHLEPATGAEPAVGERGRGGCR